MIADILLSILATTFLVAFYITVAVLITLAAIALIGLLITLIGDK